jgi:hypothetical protein
MDKSEYAACEGKRVDLEVGVITSYMVYCNAPQLK